MWDLPRPGIKPTSPALAGRFLTTAPPGRSPNFRNQWNHRHNHPIQSSNHALSFTWPSISVPQIQSTGLNYSAPKSLVFTYSLKKIIDINLDYSLICITVFSLPPLQSVFQSASSYLSKILSLIKYFLYLKYSNRFPLPTKQPKLLNKTLIWLLFTSWVSPLVLSKLPTPPRGPLLTSLVTLSYLQCYLFSPPFITPMPTFRSLIRYHFLWKPSSTTQDSVRCPSSTQSRLENKKNYPG